MNKGSLKKAVGLVAAQLVPPNIIVGLGSGSTASYFIQALAERVRLEKLPIKGVASSQKSHTLASSLGIQMIPNEDVTYTDLTIDGADEIDPQKCLIKGGGGYLVREKILATISHEMIVIVDESKLVKKLGSFGLPVEILPFCYHATIQKIASYGFQISLREYFTSDNGNFIVDLHGNFDDLINTEKQLSAIPGVVDTGLFLGIAGRVIIGRADGSINILK
ncbi:MAG: ribose-5-phosphate isomerase RpiA [Chlamydiae bacterium]|nr:ribose-5-phosphate isomerase RpiA [Chlamydiota bacterium]